MPRRRTKAWKDKPKAERVANSHEGKTEIIDSLTFAKWCENCAERFLCVERSRRLCAKCECEKNGIDIRKVSVLIGGKRKESK